MARQMSKFIDEVRLFTDGGCRGNPGPGAIGVMILDGSGNELFRWAGCIGNTTNNRAEYRALIKGLDACAKYTRRRVICHTDSQLIVNQLNGEWRLKDDELRQLWHKVKDMERVFDTIVYQHTPRTNPHIQRVDRLLNEAFEAR